MRMLFLVLSFLCFATSLYAQQAVVDTSFVDNKYREDQFYFSLTYDLLGKKPAGIKQSGFSNGVHFGVIRDMPINERRNKAIGIGLGFSMDTYNQNLLISPGGNNDNFYEIIDESQVTISKNKFTTYAFEVPLQFRWRTSTAKDYKFWRVYAGVNFGYVFYNSSKFRGSTDDFKFSNNADFEKLQYGLTLSAGYSTWNFHIYYGLNSIFKETAKLDNNPIDMTSIKIGLMFYIL